MDATNNHSEELGGQSLVEADFQSPIDLTTRTPTHIRFAESRLNQLVEHPAAGSLNRDLESISSQMIAVCSMEEEIRRLQAEVRLIRRNPPASGIFDRQSGEGAKLGQSPKRNY